MPISRPDADDVHFFASPAELRAWFDRHHETASELWLGTHKKATGKPSVAWSDAVDEALCVGWIDSVRYSLDEGRAAQRFTPRRPGSNWSAINVKKIETLRAEGRMRPAGEAAFALRREDRTGVYSFENRHKAELSADEEASFRGNPDAWSWFERQAPSFRTAATWWVVSPKRPETRVKRLQTLIEDASEGRKPRPLRPIGRG